MNEMNEKLNLSKGVVLNLMKGKGIETQKANVVLCMDYSGSMAPLYSNGFVQRVLERIVPVAMAFDDDGEMEMYIFSDSAFKVLPNVTKDNLQGYIRNNIMSKYSYGGTNYAPAITMITNNFTRANGATTVAAEKSIASTIGSWFGAKKKDETKQVTADLPTLVLFFTDGENFDKAEAQQAIIDASKHGVFWEFVGLKSNYSDEFKFLKKLDIMPGRFIDNANFIEETDDNLLNENDNDLYSKLLNEFPSWTKEAAAKKLILTPDEYHAKYPNKSAAVTP